MSLYNVEIIKYAMETIAIEFIVSMYGTFISHIRMCKQSLNLITAYYNFIVHIARCYDNKNHISMK